MTAPVLDERIHRDALVSLLAAEVGDIVYDYGQVPGADGVTGTLPNIFCLLGLERRYADPTRSGMASRSGWRLTVRYVGRTVKEARWAGYHVAAALDGARLTVGDHVSTPVRHETTQAIALDDGRFAGWASYTYSL